MKKVKIILLLLVVIIIAALAAVVVLFGDKFAITNKSKVSMGLSKTMNSFTLSDEVKDSFSNYKIMENLGKKTYESEVSMSVKANIDDLENLVGDEDLASSITNILEEISNADVTFKVALDQEERKGTLNLKLDAEDIIGTISGDAAFSSDTVGFRSEDLNKKYLVVNKDDSEELEQAFEMFDAAFDIDYSKLTFTDEDVEYLKDTYGKILKEYVTDDMLSGEKTDFEVNGKTKSCSKETLTLNNEQVKELLTKYVETYENDEKGREIIEGIFSFYGEELATQMKSSMDEAITSIKEAINEIENTQIEFVTYCSFTKVYGTEWKITVNGETAELKETFNDDETVLKISMQDQEIANLSVKNNSKDISMTGTINLGTVSADIEMSLSTSNFKFAVNVANICNVEISCDRDLKKNTDKELDQSMVFKVAVNVSSVASGDITFNINENMKIVNSVDFPDLEKGVSILDQEELTDYVKDCEKGLTKYMEKLQKSSIFEEIQNLSTLKSKSIIDNDFDIDDDDDWDFDEEDSENEDAFLEDVENWVDSLEGDDELSTSEIIEQNMISKNDFSDKVSLNLYTTWKKGEKVDEGYFGIEVIDEDDNSYEYYLDLEDGTLYTEDNAPSEIEDVNWNNYK